jgi:hypothetical protein
MTLSSIFEIVVSFKYQTSPYSIEYVNYFLFFIVDLHGGDFFENFANFLYFISLALYFVFYYNFDRMFRMYFRKWFFKEITTPNQDPSPPPPPPPLALAIPHKPN